MRFPLKDVLGMLGLSKRSDHKFENRVYFDAPNRCIVATDGRMLGILTYEEVEGDLAVLVQFDKHLQTFLNSLSAEYDFLVLGKKEGGVDISVQRNDDVRFITNVPKITEFCNYRRPIISMPETNEKNKFHFNISFMKTVFEVIKKCCGKRHIPGVEMWYAGRKDPLTIEFSYKDKSFLFLIMPMAGNCGK